YAVDSARFYRLTPADRGLQFASIHFDASAEEIFSTLLSGATLVLRDEAMLGSPRGFLAAIETLAITVLTLPTAYWHELAAALGEGEAPWPAATRLVSIGGEKARAEPLARWQSRRLS